LCFVGGQHRGGLRSLGHIVWRRFLALRPEKISSMVRGLTARSRTGLLLFLCRAILAAAVNFERGFVLIADPRTGDFVCAVRALANGWRIWIRVGWALRGFSKSFIAPRTNKGRASASLLDQSSLRQPATRIREIGHARRRRHPVSVPGFKKTAVGYARPRPFCLGGAPSRLAKRPARFSTQAAAFTDEVWCKPIVAGAQARGKAQGGFAAVS